MMTTNLFATVNAKQLWTGGSFGILLPFFWISWGVGVLNSAIFKLIRMLEWNTKHFPLNLQSGLTLSNFRDVGGGFEFRNQIGHCKTVCTKRNLYLINYNSMRTKWNRDAGSSCSCTRRLHRYLAEYLYERSLVQARWGAPRLLYSSGRFLVSSVWRTIALKLQLSLEYTPKCLLLWRQKGNVSIAEVQAFYKAVGSFLLAFFFPKSLPHLQLEFERVHRSSRKIHRVIV